MRCVCGHRRHRYECGCGCRDYVPDDGSDTTDEWWWLGRGDVMRWHSTESLG